MGERVARSEPRRFGLPPLAVGLAVAVMAAIAAVAVRPARYVVDGLSMAPGLMPGDVVTSGWLPALDRWRTARRFDRWVVAAPEAPTAIKRVAGLPGETLEIVDGDLAVDGAVVLKPPAVLAELALELPWPDGAGDSAARRLPRREVLDDATFAREVNRPLAPVGDAGLAAIVQAGTTSTRLHLAVDDTRITWRLAPGLRACFVVGRLDGHVVAVGWRLPGNEPARPGPMPGRPPARWSLATPRPAASDGLAPALAIDLDDSAATIERLTLWRDVHYRHVDGEQATWTLGTDEHVMLGDFPTASRDSRHWGPLPHKNLRHRIDRRP